MVSHDSSVLHARLWQRQVTVHHEPQIAASPCHQASAWATAPLGAAPCRCSPAAARPAYVPTADPPAQNAAAAASLSKRHASSTVATAPAVECPRESLVMVPAGVKACGMRHGQTAASGLDTLWLGSGRKGGICTRNSWSDGASPGRRCKLPATSLSPLCTAHGVSQTDRGEMSSGTAFWLMVQVQIASPNDRLPICLSRLQFTHSNANKRRGGPCSQCSLTQDG